LECTFREKRLLRLFLEGAWVRENAFVALQPTVAFLPILAGASSTGLGLSNCGEGGWISERNLCLPGLPPILILPDNASRKEALAILSAMLDGKET
jgi:hypothetical protein